MNKLFLWVLAIAGFASAQISSLSLPHTLDSATIPKVSYVDDNDVALKNRLNIVIDSVNSDSILTLLQSNSSLRLTLDADANATGTCIAMTHNGAADTIAKFCDDLSGKAFGRFSVVDSIIGASMRLTGTLAAANGTYSGTLGVTGAVTGSSSVTATGTTGFISTGTVGTARDGLHLQTGGVNRWLIRNSSAAESGSDAGSSFQVLARTDAGVGIDAPIDITRAAGGAITLARPVSMSSTLSVSSTQTNSEAIVFNGNGTPGSARLYKSATDGMALRGATGSGNDLILEAADGTDIMRNTTGTTAVVFPAAGGVAVSGALNSTGLITGAAGFQLSTAATGAAGKIYASTTNGTVIWGIAGSTNDVGLANSSGTLALRIPTGTTTVDFPGTGVTIAGTATTTGVHTFTAVPVFNGNTANRILYTGASKALSTAAELAFDGTTITMGSGNSITASTGAGTWTSAQTFTAAPVLSALTASLPVFTNGSKVATSNAMTGTGSVVMSASPTLTGTIAAASQTLSGTLAVTGTAAIGGSPNPSYALSLYDYPTLTGTSQYGGVFWGNFTSAATASGSALFAGVNAGGSMTNAYGLYIESAGLTGSITNNYGIKVADQAVGSTNYAIYTGSGDVRFGDDLFVIGKTNITDSLVLNKSLSFVTSATPPTPTSSGGIRQYQKDSKIVFQYNDAGTVRYKYLDMAGTGVTWVHTTTAP